MGSCYNCRSRDTAEKRIIRHIHPDGRQPRAVKNLPATVCRVCGPVGFSGPVMDALEKIRAGKVLPAAYQSIPVFDLQNPQGQPERMKAGTGQSSSGRSPGEPLVD